MHDDGASVGVSTLGIGFFFEATAHGDQSMVLQPGQLAPSNQSYERFNTTENSIVPDPTITELNSYGGG